MWPVFDYRFDEFGAANGHVSLVTPEGDVEALELPESLAMVNERVSTSVFRTRDTSRMYVAGGMTDNTMITEHRHFLRQFIAPMSQELVEDATPSEGQIGFEKIAAAAGLVGNCIFYLRWRDSLHGRRSPFSGATPTIVMSGTQALTIRQVPTRPTPEDYCVDEVELWCNRNGESLNGEPVIRHIATRDAGAPTITITEYIEGEAETASNLQKAPRCRFNIVYHQRLYQFGNEQFPDRAFASVLNRLSEHGGLYVGTLNGDPITAAVNVRDTLWFFSPRSSYILQGYSERDLKMRLGEPDIGCINHFGIKMIDDIAIIPTHRGFYACTGTSLVPISGDYTRYWSALYAAAPSPFNDGFAVNDKVAGLYKFWEAGSRNRFWVMDYSTFAPMAGGGMAPPLLSFDKFDTDIGDIPVGSAMLAKPSSKEASCYTFMSSGKIVRENVWGQLDYGIGGLPDGLGSGVIDVVIQPFMLSDDGGGPHDGMTLHEMWLFLTNHLNSPNEFDLVIQYGNEWAALYRADPNVQIINTTAVLLAVNPAMPGKTFLIADSNGVSFATPAGAGATSFGQALVLANLNLSAEGFSPRITVRNPRKLCYRGFGMNVAPGKKRLAPMHGVGGG